MAHRPLLLAVDGRSGAGKTSLALETAALLRAHLDVAVFHLDAVYPGWDGLAPALGTYAADVLAPLAAGRTAHWTWWDWSAGAPGRPGTTAPADVVILEGVGAGHRGARPLLDALAWVEMPAGARRHRALERDGETFAAHWDRWAAQEDAYLAGDDPAGAATVTVDGAAGTPAAAAALVAALRTLPGWEAALSQVPAPPRADRRRRTLAGAADPHVLFAAAGGPEAATAMLLESSDHATTPAPARSRHAIVGVAAPGDPVARHGDGVTTVRHGAVTVRHPGPLFRWLAGAWPDPAGEPSASGAGTPGAPAAGPFTAGWMGWLGYGLKREAGSPDGAATARAEAPTPADALLFRPGRVATVDHRERTTTLWWSADDDGGAAWADRVAAAVAGDTAGGGDAGGAGSDGTEPGDPAAARTPPPAPAFTVRDPRERYLGMVRAAQHEIYEGNTYEVCLTTMLEADLGTAAFDGWGTYRRLVAANRAPFTLYLRAAAAAGTGHGTADVELLSTSPERFLALAADGRLVTEPIKGTRPRGATPERDRELAAELAASTKDRAENIMITDLARNDLSRVAVPGTVAAERVCAIESYPTVHQMVSTVTARLEPGVPRTDAVAAAFPPGSMTGAPKISTMDILERLESGPRGVYSGVAGYLSDDGAADLSVLIRTLVATREPAAGAPPGPDGATGTATGGAVRTRLSLGVGGAITADSDPEEEWDEVRTKAHGVLRVLGSAFPDEAPLPR
ncbi:aminodeoxychorismate synthase component I [Citricoccus sp. SGAir0253]|uniref:chorismate-binding protein n=1 Tax=Citricoccus sp. SGAir0253 TaxID=2567881 RepID=UPI0010CD2D56|nr:chorismate-binding protein [Citricoccus sp. SGAir0253]QCU77297.1 aminodeoxychorismate synthase component I [Citricoccus sp. SGAir0253]